MKVQLVSFLAVLAVAFCVSPGAKAQMEPPHNMNELEAYSVFVDAYQNEDYELAEQYGEWMLKATPKKLAGHAGFSLERHFMRMVDVYVGLGEAESDPGIKSEHFQNAEATIEQVFEVFSEDEISVYDWHLRHGRFYHENNEHLDATMDDAVEAYMKLYEMDAQQFAEEGDGFFARVLLMELADSDEREKAFAIIDDVESHAGTELQQTVDEVRNELFESPEERIEFLESRVADAESEEKEEMLNSLLDLYGETDQSEKAGEIAIELCEMNKNFENTRAVADVYLSDGEYREAVGYLNEAMDLADSDDVKKEIALEISESYQQLDEHEQARNFAQKSLSMDENYGEAYFGIASIYTNTISNCTNGGTLDREDRAVYWLVLDYLDKAKQADSSLVSNANNRAESYEGAMPSAEHKFFSGWEEGDSFQINGELKE